ncbi:MAG TPA: HAMP domain-containing sensor histidine kinase [Ktedonobacterales bacterium]
MSIGKLPRSARQWVLDRVSIRMRLALWYAALLSLTLTLFSLAVFTVTKSQLEAQVDQTLQRNGHVIASTLQTTLQGQLYGVHSPTPGPATATTTAPTRQPTTTASSATPQASVTTAPTSSPPTPVPTVDPARQSKISKQLNLHGVVPDLLGQFDVAFEVLDERGVVEYYAPNVANTGLPIQQNAISAALQGQCVTYTMRQRGSLLRLYALPITLPETPGEAAANVQTTNGGCASPAQHQPVIGVVLVGKPLDDVISTLGTLSRLLEIGAVFAVLFTSAGGWLIAGNGLHPLTRMTRTARAIAVNAHAAGLGRRVGYRGPRDEVGELAATLDDMLAAIERVANAQKRFVADASHELRAPLTTIKGTLEFLQRAPDLPEDDRLAMLADGYAEADRMATLVSDLLLLARADAAAGSAPGSQEAKLDDQMRGRRELVELDQLALETFRYGRAQLLARHRTQIQMSITELEPMATMADPGQLRQVMLILLDNAIKYTPSGGSVHIAVTRKDRRAAISISDTGIGIEPEVRQHIFERFYRGDLARDRDQQGSGLGLAIAKWIVEAHSGEIVVTSEPGKGSTFTVLLPEVRRPGETSVKVAAVRGRQQRSVVAGAVLGAKSSIERIVRVSRPVEVKNVKRKPQRERAPHRDGKSGKTPVVRPERSRSTQPPATRQRTTPKE